MVFWEFLFILNKNITFSSPVEAEEGNRIPKRLNHSVLIDLRSERESTTALSVSQILRLEFKFTNDEVSKELRVEKYRDKHYL